MKTTLAALAAVLLLATSCSGRGDADPSPAPDASPTQGEVTATAAPSPPATAPGGIQVASRALLLEVATGKVTTIFESTTQAAYSGRFDGNVIEIGAAGGVRRFNLDGSAAPPGSLTDSCKSSAGGVEIGGRRFADVRSCGTFSPDGRWMTYPVDAGEVTLPGGHKVPSWDQWVLEVPTGAKRELQKGLVHCGGCDGRYGPRWSPTSRYVAYAEYGGPRRFLSDVTTGKTRVIGGGNDVTFAPQWATTGDRIVYSTGQTLPAIARFEDLDTGLSVELPVAWPVTFDASGRYLYSPAWGEGPNSTGQTTTVIDVASLSVAADLSGAPPPWIVWRNNDTPIAIGAQGIVAALQLATGCEGTSITVGSALRACVQGGTGGVVNSKSSFVAVAKAVGVTGPARGPGFETIQMTRYNIELFDVSSRNTRTGLRDILSWDYQAPVMTWNEAGTHLLVLAPSATGL